MASTIHVFVGTKAQYIKTAPLLRLMDERKIGYRLIDSGQHGRLSASMRSELAVRLPDYILGRGSDVSSVPHALRWAAGLAVRLRSPQSLRREIFGGRGGICVVHGDTPSTLMATLMARRARLRVAHLEAGLRSFRFTHPFPEELVRVIVMHLSHLLFAPDGAAEANLARMALRGRVVCLPANTSIEAVRYALGTDGASGLGPAIVTMHRVENLHSSRRVEGLVNLVAALASNHPVRFVMHEPTQLRMARSNLPARLQRAGVELMPLMPHRQFVRSLAEAPLVITDGGSVQEECAVLGVPTLLWRDRSERPDGLGANVVLSHYDPHVVAAFLVDPDRYRRDPLLPAVAPSERILDELLAELHRR
jgi:UDP-N-acetylglucosamine 2-epimerase (non-hydrolysing)